MATASSAGCDYSSPEGNKKTADTDEIQGSANSTEGVDGDSFFLFWVIFFFCTNYIYKRSKKHHIVGPQNLRSDMMDQKDEKKEHVSLSSWGELNHHVWTQLSRSSRSTLHLGALELIPDEIDVSLCLSPISGKPTRQPGQIIGMK